MTAKCTVKVTANFESNLEELETFWAAAQVTQAYDALLDELTDTIIPNLESYPGIGRLFLQRPARSVEVANGMTRLTKQLETLAKDGELREYVMTHYLLLYAQINDMVYLLAIRHQRQLSFDFEALWPRS